MDGEILRVRNSQFKYLGYVLLREMFIRVLHISTLNSEPTQQTRLPAHPPVPFSFIMILTVILLRSLYRCLLCY